MPERSRFYGTVIQIHFGDHLLPHFQALYGSSKAVVDIEMLAVIEGRLPPRARGIVGERATSHQQELREALCRAEALESPGRIAPLE